MCRPDHYEVSYSINPWMDPKVPVDQKLAKFQWQKIKNLIQDFLKLKVNTINQKQGLPDMVFSTDSGLVYQKNYLQANFKYPQRQPEPNQYAVWFKKHGFKIKKIPAQYKFEGGDFLFWQTKILAGFGFRTQKNSLKQIEQIMQKEIIPLQLTDPYLYHLDMALTPLDQKTLVCYPGAFSPQSFKKLKNIAQVIEASRHDVLNFSLNSLVYHRKIIVNKGFNSFLPQLMSRNFKVAEVDVSEFKKAGGGIHCLSCIFN